MSSLNINFDENIVYYCKDCREIVPPKRVGKRFAYICPKCGTRNVAFGSYKSVCDFYHVHPKTEA